MGIKLAINKDPRYRIQDVLHLASCISHPARVGSAFVIPKAALKLAGFHPEYSLAKYGNPEDRLKGFGGGWQDQFGGLFEGVKLIESGAGLVQKPRIQWAPDHLFSRPETSSMILLYYTGITRVAKHILNDIVKGMFLNSSAHLAILSEMKIHARDTYKAIQNHEWEGLRAAIKHSWELNQRLDAGTNTSEIEAIVNRIKDLMVSCKLLGAGGGGYLMIFAKDPDASQKIRAVLQEYPPNPRGRFVDWGLSVSGLEITKS